MGIRLTYRYSCGERRQSLGGKEKETKLHQVLDIAGQLLQLLQGQESRGRSTTIANNYTKQSTR